MRLHLPDPVVVFRAGPTEETAERPPALGWADSRFVLAWTERDVIYTASSRDGFRWTSPERLCVERERPSTGPFMVCCGRFVHLLWQSDRAIRYARSTNSGGTWEPPTTLFQRPRTSLQSDELSSFAGIDETLYATWRTSVTLIAGQEEPISAPFGLLSTNDGGSWRALKTAQPTDAAALSERLLVGSIRGEELRSEDGGLNWKRTANAEAPRPPQLGRSEWRPLNQTVFAASIEGDRLALRRSDDLGQSWGADRRPLGALEHVRAIRFSRFEARLAVLALTNGSAVLARSVNAGGSFELTDLSAMVKLEDDAVNIACSAREVCAAWWGPVRGRLSLAAAALPLKR